MNIILNGDSVQISDTCVSINSLISFIEIPTNGIAVAIGKSVVTRDNWDNEMISEGVEVTIIRATQGG